MNISRESPAAERDLVILMTMRANPKVWTVPLRVKITENSLSEKRKRRRRMMTTSPIQYLRSLFWRYFMGGNVDTVILILILEAIIDRLTPLVSALINSIGFEL